MLWLHPGMPPLGHRACLHPSVIMPYPGFGFGLTPPDARTATLRENRLSRHPRALPARPPHLGSPPGGAGSARPQLHQRLHQGMSPVGHRVIVNACGGNEMSRLEYGLPTRTHRVRPSEKTALSILSGLSPQGHPNSDSRPRGGAGSARPQGRHNANSNVASSWPLGHPQRMWWKWNASALVRPCHADAQSASLRENRLPLHFRALLRQAIRARITNPAEGRAPHARNDGTTPTQVLSSLGHRFIVNSCGGNGMPRRAHGLAIRARRPRPSEETTSALSPAFPRKAIRLGLTPAEGRAPHARKESITLTPTFAPFGHRLVVNLSGGNGMPRLAYGLATRARRPRPSEKNPFRAISSPSPQGHLTLARPLEGRAPHARGERSRLTGAYAL
jgi:hypothetical protein